jgi:type I site-specific restriction-modification system R (restriction) subunit
VSDETVNDLLSQLQEIPRESKANEDSLELTPDNVEEFLLKYSGRLIKDSVESVENLKDFIDSAPDADHSEALASLIRSATSSIDILQRIVTSREKNTNTKEVTQMKIDSQQAKTNKEIGAQLLLTREELLKELIDKSNDSDTIDVEVREIETE